MVSTACVCLFVC